MGVRETGETPCPTSRRPWASGGGALYGDGRERRRAKTYGLHFLQDYFPHRERGVCLYRLGELAEAEREFEESLRQLPTGRAKYFLNQVRRHQLQQGGTPPPPKIELDLDAPDGVWYVNTPAIELRGRIRSPHRISRVAVNGARQFIELAEEAYELDREVRPGSGERELTVQASDLLGRESVWRKRVVVDLRGPAISVSRSSGPDGVRARVDITDNVGLASVTLDGAPRVVAPGAREATLTVPVGKGTRAEVKARDAAGNTTVLELKGDELSRAFRESFERYPDRQLAWAGTTGPRREVLLADAGGLFRAALAATEEADTLPPELTLVPDVGETVRVSSASYLVDVEAEDKGVLDSLVFAIDGAEQPVDLRGKNAKIQRMTQRFELAEGKNGIEIRAKDRAGNVRVRRFEVHRVPTASSDEELRMTADVLPPEDGGPRELRRLDFYSLLMQALLQAERLNLVERDPAVFERGLLELKLSGSGLADYRKVIEIGEMDPAEWLLKSRLRPWGGSAYEFVGEVVDVETGRPLVMVDVYLATADREHVRHQVGGFAEKLGQSLPTRSAEVASVSPKGAIIPLGKLDNVTAGMRFLFFAPGALATDFPDPKEHEGQWVQGRVSSVGANSCRATVVPKEALELVRAGDGALLR